MSVRTRLSRAVVTGGYGGIKTRRTCSEAAPPSATFNTHLTMRSKRRRKDFILNGTRHLKISINISLAH